MVFVALITMIGYFQLFAEPYVMTQGGPAESTLSVVLLMYEEGFRWWNVGYGAAIAFVLFAIVLVPTVVQLRLRRQDAAAARRAGGRGAPRGGRRGVRRIVPGIAVNAVLAVMAAFTFLPLAWMVSASFMPTGEASAIPPRLLPSAPTLAHYRALFTRLDL